MQAIVAPGEAEARNAGFVLCTVEEPDLSVAHHSGRVEDVRLLPFYAAAERRIEFRLGARSEAWISCVRFDKRQQLPVARAADCRGQREENDKGRTKQALKDFHAVIGHDFL